MTIRTIRRIISFLRPFYLKGVDRVLPPRDYDVVTDEELIEGLSFSAYRRRRQFSCQGLLVPPHFPQHDTHGVE